MGVLFYPELLDLGDLRVAQLSARLGQVTRYQQGIREQLRPASQHFLDRPLQCPFLVDAHDDVVVVAHHGIGGDVDGEDPGELHDALSDPAAAVVEVLTGKMVLSAQEGAPHAPAHAVVPRGVFDGDEGGAGAGHGGISCCDCRKLSLGIEEGQAKWVSFFIFASIAEKGSDPFSLLLLGYDGSG